MRSFIAVEVPAESAALLEAAQDRLRAADASVKWVKADGFHITLKFLGEVERGRLEETWEAVSRALTGAEGFLMRFRGIGAFPNSRRPRVVWAGVEEGAGELVELARRAEEACEGCGFERERRAFHAHLTLGRARSTEPDPRLAAVIDELRESELGGFRVERVVLMKSELTRGGANYEVIKDHSLV